MTVVTINARVNAWTAEMSNVVSEHPFERHFTVEGNIHRGTRFALGAELTGLMVSVRRTFQGLDSQPNRDIEAEAEPRLRCRSWPTTSHRGCIFRGGDSHGAVVSRRGSLR